MAGSPKIEDDEPDHTTTTDIPNASESLPKGNKTKSHSRDKDSKDSPGSASAKRRCVSTACIACRRRKSKVCSSSSCPCCDRCSLPIAPNTDRGCKFYSVMAIPPVAPLAHLSTALSASTILIQTTVAKASTRRTSTTLRPATLPCRL